MQWYRDGKPTDLIKGHFFDGRVTEQSTYTFEDGVRYEGEFVSNIPWGYGALIIPKGHYATAAWEHKGYGFWKGNEYFVYGKFVRGELKEKCTDENCKSMMPQEWIADENNCQVWNPKPQQYETITWSGKCVNGKVSGKGVVQWFLRGKVNGKQEGVYSDGKLTGRGKIVHANGSTFDGEFQDGKRSGFGTLSLVKGDSRVDVYGTSGEWIGSRFVVQGLFDEYGNIVRTCSSKANCQHNIEEGQQQAAAREIAVEREKANRSGGYSIYNTQRDSTKVTHYANCDSGGGAFVFIQYQFPDMYFFSGNGFAGAVSSSGNGIGVDGALRKACLGQK